MKRLLLLVALAGCSGESASPSGSTSDAVADSASTTTDTGEELADSASPVDTSVEPTDAPSSDAPADAPADAMALGPYPAGPYGNKVGDVVANLAWEGYVNPLADGLSTTKAYVTADLDKLRRDAKKGYALVHVSEFF